MVSVTIDKRNKMMLSDQCSSKHRCHTVPADQQQLLLRGPWAVLLPDVHGKECGAAVEDGGQ